MYIQSNGLGKYRGMGLNCPGDPGCPGYVDPNVNAAIQAAIADLPYPETYVQAQRPAAPGFTEWINQNAGKVALGAGAFVVLLMVGRLGR